MKKGVAFFGIMNPIADLFTLFCSFVLQFQFDVIFPVFDCNGFRSTSFVRQRLYVIRWALEWSEGKKTDLCEKLEIPVSSDFFSALFLSDINKISDGSADLLWMCSCVHNATKQQPPRLIFFSLRFAYTSTLFTRTSAKIEGFFFLQPSYRLTVETNQI